MSATMSTEYASGRTGTSSPPAAFAEVVCADPDLLALEFDALMAANYPDVADRPDPRPPRRTGRLLARRLPPTRPSLSARRESAPFADEQADEEHAWARQRGPPGGHTSRHMSAGGGDALTTDRAGLVAPYRTRGASDASAEQQRTSPNTRDHKSRRHPALT